MRAHRGEHLPVAGAAGALRRGGVEVRQVLQQQPQVRRAGRAVLHSEHQPEVRHGAPDGGGGLPDGPGREPTEEDVGLTVPHDQVQQRRGHRREDDGFPEGRDGPPPARGDREPHQRAGGEVRAEHAVVHRHDECPVRGWRGRGEEVHGSQPHGAHRGGQRGGRRRRDAPALRRHRLPRAHLQTHDPACAIRGDPMGRGRVRDSQRSEPHGLDGHALRRG